MNAKKNLMWTLVGIVLSSLLINAYASCNSCSSCRTCTCHCSCPCGTAKKCPYSAHPEMAKQIAKQSRTQFAKRPMAKKHHAVTARSRYPVPYYGPQHPRSYRVVPTARRVRTVRSMSLPAYRLQHELSLMPMTVPYHLYFSVGAEAYAAQFDGVTTGLVQNGQLMGAMDSSTVKKPLYQLRVGYQWANNSDSLISKIFGTQNAIELKGDYGSFDTSQQGGAMDKIRIFYIDGSEQYKEREWNVDYTNLAEEHETLNLGLYFKGKKAVSPNFSYSPYVGLVYGQDLAKENVDIGYYFYQYPETYLRDAIQQRVDTDYYGVSIGSKFCFLTSKPISPFFEIEGQVLEAEATLDSHQAGVIDDSEGIEYDIKDLHASKSKMAYHLIGTAGLEFRFVDKPLSWRLILKGGIDYWSYKPQVKMPIHESQRVYIADNHVSNPFFGLELLVPIN